MDSHSSVCSPSFTFARAGVSELAETGIVLSKAAVPFGPEVRLPPAPKKVHRRPGKGMESDLQKCDFSAASVRYLLPGQKSDKGCITEGRKVLCGRLQRSLFLLFGNSRVHT